MKPITPILKETSICFLLLLFCSVQAAAQPQVRFELLAQNLKKPLEIKNAGDGSGRIFIAEQGGLIKIYKNGAMLDKPFLDLRNIVGKGQFLGIWSMAFSPNYKDDRSFFLFYTDKDGESKIARFRSSKTNPDSAIRSSGVVLLTFPLSDGYGHYGNMHFGKDGYLYFSLGAGINANSQNPQKLYGKMLRLDVNLTSAPYYSIPTDNPFVNDPDVRDEIWHLGLRNAWRWSFDSNNDDMWIADVGENLVEEINYNTSSQSGVNFGWQCYEGTQTYKLFGCRNISQYVFPVFEYQHYVNDGGECVTGGYVYRGAAYPGLQGYYICIDLYSTNLWKIKKTGSGWDVYRQSGMPKGIASFGEGEDRELYAVSWTTGSFFNVQQTAAGSFIAAGSASSPDPKTIRDGRVYPTVIYDGTITLNLTERYAFARLIDISGHQLAYKSLEGTTGKVSWVLPRVNSGLYVVQLSGKNNVHQKIYIAR